MVRVAGKPVRRIGNTWGIVWASGEKSASVYKWNAWARRLDFTVVWSSDLGGTFTPDEAALTIAQKSMAA